MAAMVVGLQLEIVRSVLSSAAEQLDVKFSPPMVTPTTLVLTAVSGVIQRT